MATGKLVVIVGETGTGKSDLAMKLAKEFDGEIVCADSRTIYKGMDIGTAKPSKNDQAKVPHHLLDLVEPNQSFTVAEFKDLAVEAIKDIQNRGKLPILVGGSGLYIDSVIYNYEFNSAGENDPINPRHRLKSKNPINQKLRLNTLVIGFQSEREVLKKRLEKRAEQMAKQDLAGETERLVKKYGSNCEAFKTPAYSAFMDYTFGKISLSEAKALFVSNDLKLAKKQRTWFKRNKSIHWFSVPTDPRSIVDLATTFLNT